MYAILKKDLFQQRFVLLGSAATQLLLTLFLPRNTLAIVGITQYPAVLLISVILAVILVESQEEKARGYDFLESLPISHLGLIATKFLELLLVCAVLTLSAWGLAALKYSGTALWELLPLVLVLSVSGMLALGSLCYSGIYILGLALFTRISLVGALGLQVLALGISFTLLKDGTGNSIWLQFVQQVLDTQPWCFLLGGLASWLLVMGVTVCFRKRI